MLRQIQRDNLDGLMQKRTDLQLLRRRPRHLLRNIVA